MAGAGAGNGDKPSPGAGNSRRRESRSFPERNSAAVAPIYVIRIVISFIHLLNFYFLFFDANIWLEYINCFIICAFLIIFIKLCRNFFNIHLDYLHLNSLLRLKNQKLYPFNSYNFKILN